VNMDNVDLLWNECRNMWIYFGMNVEICALEGCL
jgi:hypothetical protein